MRISLPGKWIRALHFDCFLLSPLQAYHPDATPFQRLNFHQKVKDACQQNRTGTVGMRICKAVIVGDVAVGKSCLVNRYGTDDDDDDDDV